jgi:two-component system OmpR family response regulator
MHILYVADRRIDAYLVKALREAGHVAEAVHQLPDGLTVAVDGSFEAIILDWSTSPTSATVRFASAAPRAFLVVVAASADEAARTTILQAGADACFTRPISFIELEARLAALDRLVLRVRPTIDPAALVMAPAEQAVRIKGRSLPLTSGEFRVMAHLVAHAGEVVGLDQLQQHIWGDGGEPRPDLIQARLSRLRRKLAAAGVGARLRTLSGHGYVLEVDVG